MVLTIVDSLFLFGLRLVALATHPRSTARYWRYEGYKRLPNPALPKTLSDKWFWRKVFDHSPVLTQVSDKLGVRDWLAEHGIEISTPKVLWRGKNAAEIPNEVLQRPVVVKGNHGYAMNIFLDRPPEDRSAFNTLANSFLSKRHGSHEYQWAYFDIEPQLFAEELISDLEMELKFYCFGSRIERLVCIFDKQSDAVSADVWITKDQKSWERSVTGSVLSESRANMPLPNCIEEATQLARTIGQHFDHIRVDLMFDGTRILLGELTVYNLGGHFVGVPEEEAALLDKAWDIRRSWFLTTPHTGWRGLYSAALLRRLNARSV